MPTRILPAVGDADAVRSITTLLSQLPDAEPLTPVVDSTQLVDTLARLAAESLDELPEVVVPAAPTWAGDTSPGALIDSSQRLAVQRAMTLGSGPVRSAEAGAVTAATLADLAALPPSTAEPGPLSWETTNLLHLGRALTELARRLTFAVPPHDACQYQRAAIEAPPGATLVLA